MNYKFFQLPMEKQQRIINAAYKVFSKNSYKKAPMSEIADVGGVSKALLFHYFTNKLELYMFLWNSSIAQIHKASSEYRVTDTTDFFEMIHCSLLAKCSVIRSYPYLYQFAVKAYYEQEPKIKSSIQESFYAVNKSSENILWEMVDVSKFRQDIDIRLIYQELLWTSDGYLRQIILCLKNRFLILKNNLKCFVGMLQHTENHVHM
ncbi:MAG: TetR/AcrR family transcriptional regulator [Lachnospiraceae bacterium]|nr:TetR/AcrR family transcriptional regulator [Lachnospiraceae bacterium]